MPAIALIDPSQNETLAGLEAKTKQANLFFRAMAHRPDVLKNFPALYASIMGPGAVERRIKAILYLACSNANKCPYCIAANTPGAKKAGLTDEQLQALKDEWDEPFTEAERTVIHYARELTRTSDAMASRAALKEHYSDEQITEITLVICMANFTNRFNNGLQILPEA
jgi:uncharacterized peroxidase-related enzyme